MSLSSSLSSSSALLALQYRGHGEKADADAHNNCEKEGSTLPLVGAALDVTSVKEE